jgi:hypothetical protein
MALAYLVLLAGGLAQRAQQAARVPSDAAWI